MYDNDNELLESTKELLKELNKQEGVVNNRRRNVLLKLVRSQYEDLYKVLDSKPHPIYGDKG